MSKYSKILSAVIIALAAFLAIASVWHDAPIVDEIPHIGAGYGYISEQSYKLNPEHPPFAKDLAGLAMKFSGFETTAGHEAFIDHSRTINDQWTFGRDLIYHTNNDSVKLVHAVKIPMVFIFILSALMVFYWARKLYGEHASIIATVLFSLSPTVIAHSRLVTTDAAALFGVLIASYCFLNYLAHRSHKNFWLSAITLGIALICKFSTFLLIPFFFILAIVWAIVHRKSLFSFLGSMVAVVALAFIVIVGPIYQLHLLNYPATEQKADTTSLLASYGNRILAEGVITASGTPVLRPFAEYGLGLLMVTQRIAGGNQIYFLGKVVNTGGPLYFPLVYLLKEPLAFFMLLLLAIATALAFPRRGSVRSILSHHFTECAMLLWLFIYWAFSIDSTVNIGVRHLMPVYGFTVILVAGQLARIWDHGLDGRSFFRRIFTSKSLIVVLLVWYLVESLLSFPHYLSSFNELALLRPSWTAGQGSYIPGGHNYVTDSNVDWGQDLWRLADWVKENNIKKINLDYFGWADQEYYLGNTFKWIMGGQYKNREQFLNDNPQGGYIAISATYFQGSIYSNDNYLWLKNKKPIAMIGNSIFVWYIK